MNCRYNNIKKVLSDLVVIARSYEFEDWRIISQAICGESSCKKLLEYLKQFCKNVR